MPRTKNLDLTQGIIWKQLLLFLLPIAAGTLFQQFYSTVDAIVVGRFLGSDALAAVGGSAAVIVQLVVGIFTGLSSGATVVISHGYGADDQEKLTRAVHTSIAFSLLGGIVITVVGILLTPQSLVWLKNPQEIMADATLYLRWYFVGTIPMLLFNMGSGILRAVGDSKRPLYFSAVASVANVFLDLLFVAVLPWGITGAAAATVISQYASGIGIAIYVAKKAPELLPKRGEMKLQKAVFREIGSLSALTCLQQSVMNFGILMVQGLVNSFGTTVMAAFAAGVKIDTIAYSPLQDFGNAFSTYVAQNWGAGKKARIRQGVITAGKMIFLFSILASCLVSFLAPTLMGFFVPETAAEVIAVGAHYLRIEGSCYLGIGILFMLYGFYRAVERPGMSVVLTMISLGTRVGLAYGTAGMIGVTGIWLAIPIGWALADAVGLIWMKLRPLPDSMNA